MNGRAQRKIVLGLTVGLCGIGWGVTAVVNNQGRFIIARAVALAVISLWMTILVYRDARRGHRR